MTSIGDAALYHEGNYGSDRVEVVLLSAQQTTSLQG